jgi:hypothetical protein
MATHTLDPRFAFSEPDPALGVEPPFARAKEEDDPDRDFDDAEPEEPSRFDDPDQVDVDQDLDDEDLEDDDGWADEEEDY